MEDSMINSMADAMQEEFKKEVLKRQDVIRGLAAQEHSIKTSIDNLNVEYQKLEKEFNDKKAELDSIDYVIKKKNDDFEISKNNSIEALDKREKEIDSKHIEHIQRVQDLSIENLALNSEKESLLKLKKELSENLKALSLSIVK